VPSLNSTVKFISLYRVVERCRYGRVWWCRWYRCC